MNNSIKLITWAVCPVKVVQDFGHVGSETPGKIGPKIDKKVKNLFIHFRTNFTGCFPADVTNVLDDFYGLNSSSDKLYTIVYYTRIV